MQKLRNTARTCLMYAAVVLLVSGYPMAAFAIDTVDSSPQSAPELVAPTPPAPEPERIYTFNPETNRWDSDKWAFNPRTGQYEQVVTPLVVVDEPTTKDATLSHPATDSPSSSSTLTVDTNATIDNDIDSTSITGDATVNKNTSAGNATTGDATAVTTIMNMINTSTSATGADFSTFVADIVGDVHGDIMLYPMLLAAMLQAANNPDESTIGVNNNATINNDVNLSSTSGDAAVTNNTTAGNATSGSANTVANVMNIINSIIAANQSFIGTINIHGNLDGDILIAPDFIPQLLASNSGSSSGGSSLVVSSEDTQSIINNIDLSAATGGALVSNNTNAGSATSGNAATNLVLLNLSGHQIVASNSLLVFVNVLGQWVGMIVDAPAGATAAALGNGVTTNNISPDLTIDVDNTSRIVNNINLDSQSGDATVAHNTSAGNATTGDATASANVANISNSQLGLSGWFGLLTINVFGKWLGSFGINTPRGDKPTPTAGSGSTAGQPSTTPAPTGPFQFIADSARSTAKSVPFFGTGADSNMSEPQAPVEEASLDTDVKGAGSATLPGAGTPSSQSKTESQFDFLPLIAAIFMIGVGIIATKYIVAFFRARGAIA